MVGPSQEPTFTMINTSGPQSFCDASVSYTLKFDFFEKYSTPVTFSAKGNPEGSSISFSRETISTTGEVTMTIHKIPTLYFDDHTITVTGVSKDKDEINKAEKLDKILQPVHSAMFVESNPSPVKYAAKLMNLCDDAVRLPLVRTSETAKPIIQKALDSANLI